MFAEMPIVKSFKKWDQHLLLNHPRLWALRLPVLVSYLIVFNLLSLLVSSLLALKPYHINQMFTWLWLLGAVEVILLALWMRRFSWFSPEKSLERTSPFNGLAEIVIYMLCILVFLSPTITSSFVLENRFGQLFPIGELEHDRAIQRDYRWDSIYPESLVEKYTRLDYGSYLEISRTDQNEQERYNHQINRTIRRLINVVNGNDYEWNSYLVTAILLLHFGVLMFAFRHVQPKVFWKTFLYAVAILIVSVILYSLIWAIGDYLYPTSWARANSFGEAFTNFYIPGLAGLLLFFSLRVLWQKRKRDFTGMNISLLPYAIFTAQIYLMSRLSEKIPALNNFFDYNGPLTTMFGDFWGKLLGFIILGGSPLMIWWVFILTKALYTRLLGLPEG